MKDGGDGGGEHVGTFFQRRGKAPSDYPGMGLGVEFGKSEPVGKRKMSTVVEGFRCNCNEIGQRAKRASHDIKQYYL